MVSLLEIANEIHLEDRDLFPIWDAVQEERRLTPEQGVTILENDSIVVDVSHTDGTVRAE